MTKPNIHLSQAQSLAERIIDTLSPACQRIEVAGSIRRKKPTVGDIELVCIPKINQDLFGQPHGDSQLEILLVGLLAKGRFTPGGKNGPNQKKLDIPSKSGLYLDLFITTPEQWGYQLAVRTGSAEFSRQLVMPRNAITKDGRPGLMPSNLSVRQAQYWDGDTPLETPQERDVLELCGGWLEPQERI